MISINIVFSIHLLFNIILKKYWTILYCPFFSLILKLLAQRQDFPKLLLYILSNVIIIRNNNVLTECIYSCKYNYYYAYFQPTSVSYSSFLHQQFFTSFFPSASLKFFLKLWRFELASSYFNYFNMLVLVHY